MKMKGPEGVNSANIEGHEYQVPKSGIIEVASENHVETLKRHGFVETDDDGNMDDTINAMEDKSELVQFIEERGGEADASMSIKKLRRLAREAVEDQG